MRSASDIAKEIYRFMPKVASYLTTLLSVLGLTVEWSASDIADGNPITVPEEIFAKGCVNTVEEALLSAQKIGLPGRMQMGMGGNVD